LLVAAGLLIAIGGLTRRAGSDVKVHSEEQAVAMARAAYGPGASELAVKVVQDQDFWTVRIGPNAAGETRSYLITLWDERAEPLTGEVYSSARVEPASNRR